MRLGMVRLDPNRLPVLLARLVELALLEQRIAELVERDRIVRLQRQHLLKAADGLVPALLMQMSTAKVAPGRRVRRLQRQGLAVSAASLIPSAEGGLQIAEIVERLAKIGLETNRLLIAGPILAR